MTLVDWLALALGIVAALGGAGQGFVWGRLLLAGGPLRGRGGAAQGFVWSGLSLAGLALGAGIGGRLTPYLLSRGSSSPYAPAIALAGAIALALAFELAGSTLGAALRRRERRYLHGLDSVAGVAVGALIGLVVVWVLGAMALQLPGQTRLREAAQRSLVLQRLNSIVPPRTV